MQGNNVLHLPVQNWHLALQEKTGICQCKEKRAFISARKTHYIAKLAFGTARKNGHLSVQGKTGISKGSCSTLWSIMRSLWSIMQPLCSPVLPNAAPEVQSARARAGARPSVRAGGGWTARWGTRPRVFEEEEEARRKKQQEGRRRRSTQAF